MVSVELNQTFDKVVTQVILVSKNFGIYKSGLVNYDKEIDFLEDLKIYIEITINCIKED